MKDEGVFIVEQLDGLTSYSSQWLNKTMIDYLDEAITRTPNKTAIIDSKSRYTYKMLGSMVDRVALGLLDLGIKKGDVISIQLPNWNEFVILHYAASKIGAITNPLVPIYRERELTYMVKEAGAKLLIIPECFRGHDYIEMVGKCLNEWPELENIVVVGNSLPIPEKMKSFASIVTSIDILQKRRDELNIEIDPNEVTEIIFTSGTTGLPKGVMHTHNTLCITSHYWIDHLQLTNEDVLFMASTFAHQTGFAYGVRLPTQYGGTAVYQDTWNPDSFLKLIETEKVTFTAGATPFLKDTIAAAKKSTADISSLKYFIALGAPIPRNLVKQAEKVVSFKILAGWGQTENGLVTLTKRTDSIQKLTETDGVAFTGMEVKVINQEGETCQAGEEGNIYCRGPALFRGYYKQIEKTQSEFDRDWFITGDRGVLDEDGYLRITGRNKDIIIRGGENIPVSYIENVLYEYELINDVQVVAMPDERLQEKACAFIQLKQGATTLTLAMLQQFLLEKGVAKQYWPEHFVLLEEFPRTASGKIQKFKLRESLLKN